MLNINNCLIFLYIVHNKNFRNFHKLVNVVISGYGVTNFAGTKS